MQNCSIEEMEAIGTKTGAPRYIKIVEDLQDDEHADKN